MLHQEENLCDPHKLTRQECSLNFPTIKASDKNCEPNTFILIDCNVCRCGSDGKIDKTQCTKHKCNNNEINTRRLNPTVNRCKPRHWYQLSRCHLCYCLNKHTLICNSDNKQEKVHLREYDLYDCGEKLIKDLSKMVTPEERLLRSVTKKVESKVTSKYTVEQTSTPKIIFLSADTSLNPSKSSKYKTEINTDSEIKFLNFNSKNKALIEKVTKSSGFMEDLFNNEVLSINSKEINADSSIKSKALRNLKTHTKNRGFIDLFNNDKDNDITSLNINSLELNDDSSSNSKATELYDDNDMNNDATKFNIDLSNVLDTILSLAARKSMISISSGDNCEPGSIVKKRCKTCFCLANGKSLCTKEVCE